MVEYLDLDWEWLTREAKVRDAQNRLGFIVTLGLRIAVKRGADAAQAKLREVEAKLDRAASHAKTVFAKAPFQKQNAVGCARRARPTPNAGMF